MENIEYVIDEKRCNTESWGFPRGSVDELRYLQEQAKRGLVLISVVAQAPTKNYDSTIYYFKKI